MTNPLRTLVTAFVVLPMAITLTIAPAAAQAGSCSRVLSIAGPTVLVAEGSSAIITVTDTANCAVSGAISYWAEPADAQSPNVGDYDGSVHDLPWAATGPNQQVIAIPVYADDLIDEPQQFVVRLGSAKGTITVAAGGGARSVSINAPKPQEPVMSTEKPTFGCQVGACHFEIVSSRILTIPALVHWETVDHTAKGGVDFVRVTAGEITIPAGSTHGRGSVTLLPGATAGRSFLVRITHTSVGTIGRSTSLMRITP